MLLLLIEVNVLFCGICCYLGILLYKVWYFLMIKKIDLIVEVEIR